MKQWQEQIKGAKILLQGSDAAQQARGKELLREVMEKAEGTKWHRIAFDLLTEFEAPPVAVFDSELNRLETELAGIQDLTDHRLPVFLRKLETDPRRAVQLREKVISRLRRWIGEELPKVKAGRELSPLYDFVAAAAGVAAYEELQEFGQLRSALFRLRLQQRAAEVDGALRNWALEEAWRLLDGLRPVPEGFKDEIERLQAEIYQVAQLHQSVQEVLQQFPNGDSANQSGQERANWPENWPENWLDARSIGESLQKLQQYLAAERVPEEWRARLLAADSSGSAALRQFLQRQARAALTLAELRDFQAAYRRLPLAALEARLGVSEEWFQAALDGQADTVRREVENAADAKALAAIGSRLRNEAAGLPSAAAQRLSALADEVGQLVSAWKLMLGGEAFTPPATQPGQLVAPEAFRTAAAKYEEWLAAIEATFDRFKSAGALPGAEIYQAGLELAGEILAQAPEHALARKLQLDAKRRLACYQLDAALARWDVAEFLRLFEASDQGGIYTILAESEEELQRLAELARREPFPGWREAAEWWAEWRAANRQLTSNRPDALRQVMAQLEGQRREQWYAALATLLAAEFQPQEYQDAAAALEAEDGDAHLQTYRNELAQRALAGWVKHFIRRGEFAAAEEWLGKLAPGHTDTLRLGTQLQVAQARALGGRALAELLWGQWHNVQAYVEEPHALLLEALRQVWEADDAETLAKVQQILARVRASHDAAPSEALAELAEWEAWLALEQNLLTEPALRYLRELVTWLKKRDGLPPGLLKLRLEKLARRWRERGNTLLLAWAYQAFQRVDAALTPLPDPTEQLRAESDRLAEQTLKELAGRADLTLAELRQLRAGLRAEENRWQDLDEYLTLLPHTVRRVGPSKTFQRAKEELEQVLKLCAELERLQEADLRAETERITTLRYEIKQLRGVALREKLQQTLERLAPLAGLGFYELRIREVAEMCGSEEAVLVYESGLCAKLAEWVNQVIAQFKQAEMEGGSMWKLISAEYQELIYRTARLLTERLNPPDLHKLAVLLNELEAEDAAFKQAIDRLEDPEIQPIVPAGGTFEPERHAEYLKLIPRKAPRTRKTYLRFDRCAQREPLATIFARSRSRLPGWVRKYLDEGVP